MQQRFRAPITVHLLLLRGGEILLLKRKNTGYADGQYSVVAGCCDGGERVTTAMIREAAEEAGLELHPEDLEVATVLHRRAGADWESVDFFFVAKLFQGEPVNREPDKCEELRFFPLGELPDGMIPYVRGAIENAMKGTGFGEWGWEGT